MNETLKQIAGLHDIKKEPGDYMKGDLLYCGKCRTPKSYLLPASMCGESKLVRAECKCGQLEAAAEEQRKRKAVTEDQRKACFSSPQFAQYTFDKADGDSKAIKTAMRFVERWDDIKAKGAGLLLWGDTGTGKTFLAACIANALVDKGERVRMVNIGEVILELGGRSTNRLEYIKGICETPALLVLDDLGAERNTGYGMEIKHLVIDRRCQTGKPLVVTTNLTLTEMKDTRDINQKRIYDRIKGVCVPVAITGESRRKQKGQELLEWMKKTVLEE